MTAQELYEGAFGTKAKPSPRSKRSEAYKLGVMTHLRYRMMEIENPSRPYEEGTAEDDAFGAGISEAWHILGRAGVDPRKEWLRQQDERRGA